MQGIWAMLGLFVGAAAAVGLSFVVEAFVRDGPFWPRRCPHCHADPGPAAYIPLLRHSRAGACRACRRTVGTPDLWLDVLAILGTALVCALRPGPALPLDLLVLWLGLAVATIDLRRRVIPNRLLLVAAVLGLVALLPFGRSAYVAGLAGAVLLLAIGLLIAWVGRGGFGLGDVKSLGALGLLLGWQRGIATLFLAVLLGGLYAAWLLLTRRATGRDAFAFGPFIALGSVAVVVLGAGLAR